MNTRGRVHYPDDVRAPLNRYHADATYVRYTRTFRLTCTLSRKVNRHGKWAER
jgi:hypothetical protein